MWDGALPKIGRKRHSLIIFQVAVFFIGGLLLTPLRLSGILLFLPLVGKHLLHHTALEHQLILQLCLLSLGQLREFLYDVLAIFQTECTNDFASFAITLCLRHIIVLFTHMHVPCSISGVLLAAVVEAGVLLLELLGTASHVLLPLGFPLAHLRGHLILHLQILDQSIHKFVL